MKKPIFNRKERIEFKKNIASESLDFKINVLKIKRELERSLLGKAFFKVFFKLNDWMNKKFNHIILALALFTFSCSGSRDGAFTEWLQQPVIDLTVGEFIVILFVYLIFSRK